MEATIVFRVGTDARSFFFPDFCQPPPVSQCVQPACAISLQNRACPMGDTVASTTAAAAAARRRSCWRSGHATADLAGIPQCATCSVWCASALLPGPPSTQTPTGATRLASSAKRPRGQGGGGARLVAADARDALAERRVCCGGAEGGRGGGGSGRGGVGVRGRSF